MSTETETALEKPVSHAADAIPESARTSLVTPKSDYGAGEFWKDESPSEKPKETTAPKTEPKQETKTVDSTEENPITQLAGKWGAKVRAPKEDVDNLIKREDKPKDEAKEPSKEETHPAGPEDDLQADPRSSPRTREGFDTLKKISRNLRHENWIKSKEIADLKSKFEAASKVQPSAQVDTTELERLRAEHKAMSDRLLLVDTKNHPAFQNQYVRPRQDAIQAANELLKANGKDFDVATLIDRPRGEIGKALQEVLKELPSLDQTEISDNVRKAWQLSQAEKAALSNAGQVNGQIKQVDSQTHVHAFDKTWDKVAAGVQGLSGVANIPANVTPQQRQMIEAYNIDMAQFRESARQKATGPTTFESIAEECIKARAFEVQQKHVMPMLAAQISDMQETIRGLKAEVEGYRSRNPNKDISPSTSEARSQPSRAKSIDELGAEMLSGMGKGR